MACTFAEAERQATAGDTRARGAGGFRPFEMTRAARLRNTFPSHFASLPLGDVFQVMHVKNRDALKPVRPNTGAKFSMRVQAPGEAEEGRRNRALAQLESAVCNRAVFARFASMSKSSTLGVRPLQVASAARVCTPVADHSMGFSQFEKCMADMGLYSGESHRHYHSAQQTQQGVYDRLKELQPIGRDNRYRYADLEYKILSKLGAETTPGLAGAHTKHEAAPAPQTKKGLNKGDLARIWQTEVPIGSKDRQIHFEGFVRAARKACWAFMYGLDFGRDWSGLKMKARQKVDNAGAGGGNNTAPKSGNGNEHMGKGISHPVSFADGIQQHAETGRKATPVPQLDLKDMTTTQQQATKFSSNSFRPATVRGLTAEGRGSMHHQSRRQNRSMQTSGLSMSARESINPSEPRLLTTAEEREKTAWYFLGKPLGQFESLRPETYLAALDHTRNPLKKQTVIPSTSAYFEGGNEGATRIGSQTARPQSNTIQDVTRQFHFRAHTSRDRASSQGQRIAPTSKTVVTTAAHKGSLAKAKALEDILPSEKLEYNGNGFYKLVSTGKSPKLIKSDQAMMEMAVSTNLRSEEIHPQFQWWRRKKETMVMGRKVDPDHYRVIAPFPTMATNPGDWAPGTWDFDPARIAGRCKPPSRASMDPYKGILCEADLNKPGNPLFYDSKGNPYHYS